MKFTKIHLLVTKLKNNAAMAGNDTGASRGYKKESANYTHAQDACDEESVFTVT